MGAAANGEHQPIAPNAWLHTKLHTYFPHADARAVSALVRSARGEPTSAHQADFENPFRLDDLAALDDETLRDILAGEPSPLSTGELVAVLASAPVPIAHKVTSALSAETRDVVQTALGRPTLTGSAEEARGRLLDAFFWELTYQKTPELYEALTEGERMHPALFPTLAPWLRGRDVLDAGAGSGRATLECLRHGARRIYAVEPSPGLLRLLSEKTQAVAGAERIVPMRGRFEALPLASNSVDTALSCSAFTALPNQGGEAGLRELWRVTRPGGMIVIIWPRPEDYGWLAARGFHYAALPARDEMSVHYRSLAVALRVAHRFYAHNAAVARYLLRTRRPEVPYRLLGDNPPHDFCWCTVRR